jgi:hypothetical protein
MGTLGIRLSLRPSCRKLWAVYASAIVSYAISMILRILVRSDVWYVPTTPVSTAY